MPGWNVYYLNRTGAAQEKKIAREKLQKKHRAEKEALKTRQGTERRSVFKGAMLAVRCGFKINNSEMQDQIHQEQENLLQKRKAKMQAMLESSKGLYSGRTGKGPVAD